MMQKPSEFYSRSQSNIVDPIVDLIMSNPDVLKRWRVQSINLTLAGNLLDASIEHIPALDEIIGDQSGNSFDHLAMTIWERLNSKGTQK